MNSAQQTTKKNNTRGKMLAQGDSPGEAKTKITHRNLKDAPAKHGCLFVSKKEKKKKKEKCRFCFKFHGG